ncbi:MAG: Cof-type HAD-IIB family hydrolase [Mycoplasmoidaceae bacterium]
MKKIGLFPGTFNNLHEGHIHIIQKALKIFDKVYIVVAKNDLKNSDLEKNFLNTKNEISKLNIKNVEVLKTENDIPSLFDELGCTHIIRGIRNTKDYEYESNLIKLYKNKNNKIEEILFFANKKYENVASSNRKLFAFDVDGTILNDKKELLDSTKKAINLLIKNNHEVILCTGRHYTNVLKLAQDLNLPNYIITSGGSALFNMKTKKLSLSNKFLCKKDIDVAINLAKKYKRELIWNNGEKLFRVYFGENPNHEINEERYFYGGSHTDPEYDDWENVKSHVYKDVLQITFKAESKIVEEEFKNIDKKISENCICYHSSSFYIDFFDKSIGKYNAINDLAKKIKINKKDIFVFGDSGNDTEMISKFENGIAMGNAPNSIKEKAKYIIGSNNNDSIYNFLLDYGYINE